MKKRFLLLAACAAVSLIPVVQTSAAPKVTTLKGTVGPGFTIVLKDGAGKKVKSLKAGSYIFVVSDKSSIHNFVLEKSGGSFEKEITKVGQTGTVTAGTAKKPIKLTKGKWKVYCEPHESTMHQDFTVT